MTYVILGVLGLLLLVAIIGLIVVAYLFVALLRDRVPYVPTPTWVIDWLVANAQIPDRTSVVDLGCGDGRVLAALKAAHPSLHAIGYERNWLPYVLAKKRTERFGVEIRRTDFFKADLHDADIVYCYLLHSVMERVKNIFERQLTSGTTVYAYAFRVPDWPIEKIIPDPSSNHKSPLFVYRIP